MFSFEKRLRKNQMDYLLKIKSSLQTAPSIETAEKDREILTNDDFATRLDELIRRVDALGKNEESKEDGVRKTKVKDEILSLLGRHKRLSSSGLSNLLNLSRTRCSEYFKELSKEGLAEGVLVGRQKFYKLVKR